MKHLFVNKTTFPSIFIRIVDDKEYKIEVFDDLVVVHVYKDGKKLLSTYKEIKDE